MDANFASCPTTCCSARRRPTPATTAPSSSAVGWLPSSVCYRDSRTPVPPTPQRFSRSRRKATTSARSFARDAARPANSRRRVDWIPAISLRRSAAASVAFIFERDRCLGAGMLVPANLPESVAAQLFRDARERLGARSGALRLHGALVSDASRPLRALANVRKPAGRFEDGIGTHSGSLAPRDPGPTPLGT